MTLMGKDRAQENDKYSNSHDLKKSSNKKYYKWGKTRQQYNCILENELKKTPDLPIQQSKTIYFNNIKLNTGTTTQLYNGGHLRGWFLTIGSKSLSSLSDDETSKNHRRTTNVMAVRHIGE